MTKSGTNELHGSAFEFLRNDVFDARNFFALEKPAFRRNQFGAAVGGPIVKNRTFWFASYEGLQARKGLTYAGLVPTPAMLTGDFSEFLPDIPIIDPLSCPNPPFGEPVRRLPETLFPLIASILSLRRWPLIFHSLIRRVMPTMSLTPS